MMHYIRTRSRRLLGAGILLVLLAFGITPQPAASSIQPGQVDPADCTFPTQRWSEGRELRFVEKNVLFHDIITTGTYGDYRFTYKPDTSVTPAILQALLRSMAGIESDWQQYAQGRPNQEDGQTRLGNTLPCDYGMLQINEQNSALFDQSPSLRSTTGGNIAAGATRLADAWDQGFVLGSGGTPIVNNNDPEQLINWYYAVAGYNAAPEAGWANNPNCGTELICNGGVSYRSSRNPEAPIDTRWNWRQIGRENYPYQERVFYNLVAPRYPKASPIRLWSVDYLGFMTANTVINYGIRPDDSLFLRDGTSFHPNLLLFRHRPILGNAFIEYDLPLRARVTITILDADGAQVGAPVLADAERAAGWHDERITRTIGPGYSYVITAERGDLSDPATYYLGKYRQRFLPVNAPSAVNAVGRAYLPVIGLNSSPIPPVPQNIIRNGSFQAVGLGGVVTRPRYWDIQAILNASPDGAAAGPVSGYVGLQNGRLNMEAFPTAWIEISQRVRPEQPGRYRLRFDVELQNLHPDSRLLLRVRPAEGDPDPFTSGQWQTREMIDETSCSSGDVCSFDVPFMSLTQPLIISFVATFAAEDTTSEIWLDNVTLIGPD